MLPSRKVSLAQTATWMLWKLNWFSGQLLCLIHFLFFYLLQIQRKLQLQIEEQGRYLQKMFEKQSQSGMNKLKESSSTLDNHSAPSGELQDSPEKGEYEESKEEPEKTDIDPVNDSNVAPRECLQEQGGTQSEPAAVSLESPEQGMCESSSQPSKRQKMCA